MLNKIMILCSFVLLFSVIQDHVRADDVFKMAHPEFFPFFAKSQDGETKGFFYDIITEALTHRLGVPVTWTQMPWKRCQNQVRFGKFDGMITVPTDERLTYSETHPDPFYLKELKLFTYKEHPRLSEIAAIRSIADIKKGGFIVLTYSGNGWHENNISILEIPTFETSEVHNVWKMLAGKRGDLVIEWPVGAKAGMDRSGTAGRILETHVSIESMPFHLLIGKQSQHRHILPRFNEIINGMKQDGTISRIVSRYY